MNISIHESNFPLYFQNSNSTEAQTDFKMLSFLYIISILISFPVNSYVIWLIVRGTGNGLATEIFTLNLCVFEILLCVHMLLCYLTLDFQIPLMLLAFSEGVLVTDRLLFESLICVERYLAVVHPVTFLKYKPLRYRLMCSAVAWVVPFASSGLNVVFSFVLKLSFIYWIVLFLVFLSIRLFCCVAVLRALKQSGPGERGREREEENHMKRRAFHLILISTVNMTFINVIYIIFQVVLTSVNVFRLIIVCRFCYVLFGLVQPVFFLHRVGKLNFAKCQ